VIALPTEQQPADREHRLLVVVRSGSADGTDADSCLRSKQQCGERRLLLTGDIMLAARLLWLFRLPQPADTRV
jgi:hypothetical protein